MLTKAQLAVSRFARDEEGAVAVIVALMLTVVIGFVALGVDVASLYRDRARVQGMSDLAALSVAANLNAPSAQRAQDSIAANARRGEALESLERGRYLRNPAIARQNRFQPLPDGAPGINAVRLAIADNAPLHFGRVLTQDDAVAISRAALASRTGGASFSLDSHLAALNDIDLNNLIEQEFGADARLSFVDISLLATTRVNLGELLARAGGSLTANPAAVLDRSLPVGSLLDAVQALLPGTGQSALSALINESAGQSIEVATLVGGIDTSLGLTVTDFLGAMDLSALDVVRAVLSAKTSGFDIAVAATVPEILSINANLTVGEPPAQSGWIALGEAGVTLHRAAARARLDLNLAPSLLTGLGVGVTATSLNIPLYIEVAGASATLTDLNCALASPTDTAAVFATAHTPLHPSNGTSVAALYVGKMEDDVPGNMDLGALDFADVLTIRLEIPVPLLPNIVLDDLTIQARSHIAVGTSARETISFTADEIASGDTRRVFGSEQILSTTVSNVMSEDRMQIRLKPGQTGLVSGLAAPIVNSLLAVLPARLAASLTRPLDAAADQVLRDVGITLGAGALTLEAHHCEPVRLVQ